MPTEMGNEAVEVCTMALDKFNASRDYENASVLIKNTLDKKFGASWHCAVGEGFGTSGTVLHFLVGQCFLEASFPSSATSFLGFDISCKQKFLLYLYYGKVGILCYKSASSA